MAVDGVTAGYGGALILHDVSLEVAAGQFVALVGPNGAGKTTLLRAVTGRLPVRSGAVRLDGVRVDGLAPYRVAALGVATIPEGRRLFDELTVRENLELGAYRPAARRQAAATRAVCEDLFPVLRDKAARPAGSLSSGEQQMVALARGLMAQPRLLVLDDPFLGLAKPVIGRFCTVLRELTGARGVAVLAAGQHVRRLLGLADRAYFLDGGRVRVAGTGRALLDDPEVRARLLTLAPERPETPP
ncbi:MAG: ABC transporter ATP-binding protein [Candidatus Rokubacteria bacterium]|nr:ABC transporter ATP-binding protein [Candidatus Rokubacteria bacterium]